ncbi:MFS transporter [Streptomyces sp. AV19]|uniref:MDR family MFS transporter n=1 Tax=Streptomyces sp. AV19 TaxID=2793068 RepID=UPI0018FE5B27|nr:MDR family MFS transporter [Streptomyces sp. AV19]MBH1934485.1 MFS transporter [Streptomyces sp. AV19]MDG4533277.1 MFS transporter [Streptomyces sp. AV19]
MVLVIPLMLALFMANLDQTIVATALPGIGADLHAGADVSWIATAYLLTGSVSTLLSGKLGDLYGRKKILQLAIGVFLVGSLLSGIARTLPVLAVSRALQGVGGGAITSLVMAITGDLASPRRRARLQAALGTVAALALIAGPLCGGAFSDGLSWRWIFYVNLPIGVVALIAVAMKLRLPAPPGNGRVDILGALTVTVFTTTVMLFTTWGGHDYPWSSPVVLGLAALAVVSLACYLAVERRAAEPVTPLRLFRSADFCLVSAQFLLVAMVLMAAMLYMPMFLQTVQLKSAFTAGLHVVPLLLGLVAAAVISGLLITRTGRYKVYPVAGAVLVAAGMAVLGRADRSTGTVALVVPLAVVGVGIGFFVQVCILVGQFSAGQEHIGTATGVLNFFRSLGGAFGAALFGAVLTAGTRSSAPDAAAFRSVFTWTVPFMALALALALLLEDRPLPEASVQQPGQFDA